MLLYVAYSGAGFAGVVALVWFMQMFVNSALSAPLSSPQRHRLAASSSRGPVSPLSSPLKVHPLPQVPPGLEDRSPGHVTLPSGLRVVHPPAPVELPDAGAGSGAVHKSDDRI